MSIDMNTIESITHASIADLQNDNNILDREELEAVNNEIKDQYVNFNNLGQDILKSIENKLKSHILGEMLEYVNNNYTAIINYDESMISVNKRIEVGTYVYKFFVVDCYNSLLPNYLNSINVSSIEQFDLYLKNVLDNDATNFKTNFIKVIQAVVNTLAKLGGLDRKIIKDANYQEIIRRYGFYIELINYGDTNDFLFNYIKPVLIKNMQDIVWRMS